MTDKKLREIDPQRFDAIKQSPRQADVEDLCDEIERLRVIADALLNHCEKENGECSECSKIVCPYEDPFHFHHDGCPSCGGAAPLDGNGNRSENKDSTPDGESS